MSERKRGVAEDGFLPDSLDKEAMPPVIPLTESQLLDRAVDNAVRLVAQLETSLRNARVAERRARAARADSR